jgi:hypothetical protein
MSIAALVTWLVTAALGAMMMTTWLRAGGGSEPRAGGFPPPIVFGHFLLAAAGLVVWVVHLLTDADAWAWVAFVVLVVVAGLGDVLVLRWNRLRRARDLTASGATGRRTGGGLPGSAPEALPERRIPAGLVAAHGLFAVTTVVLVLLVALGVGGS